MSPPRCPRPGRSAPPRPQRRACSAPHRAVAGRGSSPRAAASAARGSNGRRGCDRPPGQAGAARSPTPRRTADRREGARGRWPRPRLNPAPPASGKGHQPTSSFDRVNHDRLVAAVAARVSDRRLLRLIRSDLTAGVLDNGVFETNREGVPQGGPLSPLLSNLVLDELDRELERRGHRFVRYADDCNVYVRSEKAGQRVMESLTRFIERRLKLQVNAEKSAVAQPWRRSFLGFTVRNDLAFRRCIADKAIARFKHRVRGLTGRHRGITLDRMIRELVPYLRGWAGYFGFSQRRELASLDGWIRRRLRCVVWVQWKTRGRRYRELRRLKVSEQLASAAIFSPKGPWRLSAVEALHRAFTKARFARLGLLCMEKLVDA